MENIEKCGEISERERLILVLIFGKIKNDLEKVGDIDKLLKDGERMPRYIDADKLIAEYDRVHIGAPGGARKLMENAPIADVAEVKHGEWIYHECVSSYDGALSGYSCSCCSAFIDEEVYEHPFFHNKYCPNCGAKMKGE